MKKTCVRCALSILCLSVTASSYSGNENNPTTTSGFLGDYTIALGPVDDSAAGFWQLASGGENGFVSSVSLDPSDDNAAVSYGFSFDLAQTGLSGIEGDSFKLSGSYTSNPGFRPDKAMEGDDTVTQGWNPFTGTGSAVYLVPEPSTLSMFSLAVLGAWFLGRRRR